MKFSTEPVPHYPHHHKHVATLPWEIENSNLPQISSRCGSKCKQIAFIASNFVIHLHILRFSTFKIARLSPHWLQIIFFFMSLFFYLFTLAINLWHRKFVTAVFVNNQHGMQRLGQDFDKHTWIHSAYTVTRGS